MLRWKEVQGVKQKWALWSLWTTAATLTLIQTPHPLLRGRLVCHNLNGCDTVMASLTSL